MDKLLAGLNERQRLAASCEAASTLIIAGAGTGKTWTLAHRVAYLIAKGVPPDRILLLTFSRRAAGEMIRRVNGILKTLGSDDGNGEAALDSSVLAGGKVWGGTFHSVAARMLRIHGKAIGLDDAFSILDRSDAEDMMQLLRTDLGLANSRERFPHKGTCLAIYSSCVNSRLPFDEVLQKRFPWCKAHREDLKGVFLAYTERKQEQSILDYDDLLVFWQAMLADPELGPLIVKRFEHVLVDEYQDTNPLQADILRLLRPSGQGLTAVGDDAQAIYSFRSATVRNIIEFPNQFPNTRVMIIEQNYRSTQPILSATNAVIAQARGRFAKDLWSEEKNGRRPWLVTCQDEDEQTDFVIERILEHRESGLDLRRQAVLFRASHHSMALELELSRRDIPFRKFGGLKFLEAGHVKDLMAFLRLAENPKDAVSGMRVLLLMPGIGPKRARVLLNQLECSPQFRCWQEHVPTGPPKDLWFALANLLQELGKPTELELANQIARVQKFYVPLMEQKYDNNQARERDLEQIEQMSTRFPDRQAFLEELTLDPPSYTEDFAGPPALDDDYLILSTIHSAKGLEWDSVYVIHAADGNIPSDMATSNREEIEEELRLFYVALTRARFWLYVCAPMRYYASPTRRNDRFGFAQLTRFLPKKVLAFFDRHTAPSGTSANATSDAQAVTTTASIRNQLTSRWL